ncbi:MAG: glutamine-hydrolyzing carbamoyl-phosphate synthase small subunit [Planctomycetes bacterium]|nr:glutamine-hydrolyzing carbamoyl-phosphate synthase small subunit [Planctomycetota bacterium]
MTNPTDSQTSRPRARLVLEDGTVLVGRGFGSANDSIGELVFNTSMTGYQEILTDPSYRGQTVLLTQPHIGNYGVSNEDEESGKLWLSGLVVREACTRASNFRSAIELSDYLAQHGVPGIDDVDTRMLTRAVRDRGEQRILITRDMASTDAQLVAKVKQAPKVADVDHVLKVTTQQKYTWDRGYESTFSPKPPAASGKRRRIVAYDFGAKRNILRSLVACGLDVTVVPAETKAEAVLALQPDGVFLSNGPGDPAICRYAIDAAKVLVHKLPVFGICLGHQILGHVFGGKTYKMKFGHHGGNQPVIDLTTGKVEITSQNHSYAVDPKSLPDGVVMTHKNLNDNTCEGLRHKELPVFSVQYHPEAAPGPHDALYLFKRFVDLLDGVKV